MSTSPPSSPTAFEPDFVAAIVALFEERIPFNRVLGLRIDTLTPEIVTGHLLMRPDLVGSFAQHRLHGGVISAALDAMAGVAIMAAIGARHMDEVPAERMRRFGKLGTIDLRIDYLRPAIGERFALEGRSAAPRLARRDGANGLSGRCGQAPLDRQRRLHRVVMPSVDRTSALGQYGLDARAALAREFALGHATLASGEAESGARRFVGGAGKHGRFERS